ncbi:hypothetical protein CDD83_6646 [Cordyceps sp. RAO-2017]|nr:hypothetical protein CDD83_6646 [Cordyceps sp. RAO-2017]
MASLASAARDIPKAASSNRDNLAVVADRSDSATVARSHTLPTPPNSISPALPAHGLKAQLQKARLEPVESDLDLHDDADADARSRLPSPAAHDASGAITSALLARHHLPEILLNHGPLAIRHIMGYLTTSVPGFSGIPPTKARRLVVGALEGRGGGDGRGSDGGEVDFEKVGWGRWDARRRGFLNARDRQGTPPTLCGAAIPISRTGTRGQDSRARANPPGSVGDESLHFSHDDHVMETEADKMSLDDDWASASCSEAPDDDVAMNDDPDDVTDDEDWAAMGAAALRAESYPSMAAAQSGGDLRTPHFAGGGLRPFSSMSSGMARPPPQPANFDLLALAGTSDAQEREAVEALLRLGSV